MLFLFFGTLYPVFRAAAAALFNAHAVERTADNVVTDTGQVFYTTASDQNNTVLLQ